LLQLYSSAAVAAAGAGLAVPGVMRSIPLTHLMSKRSGFSNTSSSLLADWLRAMMPWPDLMAASKQQQQGSSSKAAAAARQQQQGSSSKAAAAS
jgi:hypothetical protein